MFRLGTSLIAAACVAGLSCDRQPVEPVPDEVLTPAFAVDREVQLIEFNADLDPPFSVDCLGYDVQGHGIIVLELQLTYLPSGNVILKGKWNYDTQTPIWWEELPGPGDVWTLEHGHNPYGEVIKENGFDVGHFQWKEFYRNQDGEKVQIKGKGVFKIDPDGNVKHNRFALKFVCPNA